MKGSFFSLQSVKTKTKKKLHISQFYDSFQFKVLNPFECHFSIHTTPSTQQSHFWGEGEAVFINVHFRFYFLRRYEAPFDAVYILISATGLSAT